MSTERTPSADGSRQRVAPGMAARRVGAVTLHSPLTDETFADLCALARLAVRTALRAAPEGTASNRPLAADLRRLCDSSIVAGLFAEEVLLLVKAAWRELPEAQRREADGSAALGPVVTLCIEEYYLSRTA